MSQPTNARAPRRSRRTAPEVISLEPRRLLCGIPFTALPAAPEFDWEIEHREAARLATEDSPDAVSIVWTNRGLASDNFAATFGTSAEAAREVVDAALDHWERIITSWNRSDGTSTLQVTISIAGNGFGGAGAPANTAPADGKPRTGSFTLQAGNPMQFPNPNDSNGWYLDPNPDDHAEFNGDILNAFAGGSGGAIGFDLYSVVVAELSHVLGLISDFGNNGGAWQGYRLESSGFATNTAIPDNAEGGGNGVFWVFDGPTVDHLMTSYNSGNNTPASWGNIVHTAGGGGNINFAGKNWRGSEDAGNALYNSGERTIPSFVMAHVLADAYGYSIVEPASFGTFYALLNLRTGQLTVRGGSGASSDSIIVEKIGATIQVSVDVGSDIPGSGALAGAGDLPPFVSSFDTAQVSSILIDSGDGNDVVDVFSMDSLTPVTVNLGAGDDTMVIGEGDLGSQVLSDISVNAGTGNDLLIFNDSTAGAGSDVYTLVSNSLIRRSRTYSFNAVEQMQIFLSPLPDVFNLFSILSFNNATVFGGGGDDEFYAANNNYDAFILGDVLLLGGAGTDSLFIDDANSTGAEIYNLNSNSIDKGPALGTIGFGSLESLTLNASNTSKTINVTSNLETTPMTINAGDGPTDTITLGAGNLDNLPGNIVLNGEGGIDNVVLNDGANVGSAAWAIHPASLSAGGTFVMNYSTVESLTINARLGTDVMNVMGTAPTTPLRINGNAGSDSIYVNETSATAPVTILPSTGNDTVQVNFGGGIANVLFDATQRIGHLAISAGGTATLTAGAGKVLTIGSLNISAGGKLNLTDNDMIVDYVVGGVSPLPQIQSLLNIGYAAGAWNGSGGITSSAAATAGNTGIGFAEATDLFSTFPATFSAQSVDSSAVLLKYTFYGDAELSGSVNLTDFNRLAANFGQSPRRWVHGNFDYDNDVDLNDFNRLASNFGTGGLSPAVGTSPATEDEESSVLAQMLR